jgi:hypothetical protein
VMVTGCVPSSKGNFLNVVRRVRWTALLLALTTLSTK